VITSGKTRVLVTDAHSTSALGVVRSLGSHGMHVTSAAEEGRFNLAAYSRYVSRTVSCPAADQQPKEYLEALEQELTRDRYDLLLPTTDTTVTLVRHHRARLDCLVRVGLPANDVLAAALDKWLAIQAAQRNAVAVPRTWVFKSVNELEKVARDLPYPCVVKPRYPRFWNGSGPMKKGAVRYVATREALLRHFSDVGQTVDAFLVQELVSGTGIGVFALTKDGDPLAVFAHRRLREANPLGSRASLAESIAPDDRLVAPALRLLKALGWTGVAMVEFKDAGSTTGPVLMEINGRFWGSLPLAIAAGVDFPLMLAQLMLGGPIPSPALYKVGVRCRHLKGDLSYLIAALKGRPGHWHGRYPSRLGAVLDIMPWPGRWRPYNFSVRDPMPALREAGNFVVKELMALGHG
jgi:predicted ATP-grasp superfamily ATP-dependent carboligase